MEVYLSRARKFKLISMELQQILHGDKTICLKSVVYGCYRWNCPRVPASRTTCPSAWLLYCYVWRRNVMRRWKKSLVQQFRKRNKPMGKTCHPGPKKPTRLHKPVPSKYTEKGNLRALPPNSETLKKSPRPQGP
uniref:Uncharacterized protein n=1 Tax=Ditylenchus dipsaci TaxID=166011 RepID=A0A915DNN3_9BILA